MDSINSYIEPNRKEYKALERKHDVDKDIITDSSKIVKKFIENTGIIIVGGTAIDYALRLKGSSIYGDDELPDYDCISDKNVDDAYDIAELLVSLDFTNIKVIGAIHFETMRVRVNLITVLDISYVPTQYYNKYKTLSYNNLRILHPNFQRMDLHKSLCFPFNNPPKEDIFNRWEKDITRFNLFEQYYPIKYTSIEYTLIDYTYELPDNYTSEKYAFHMFAAYAILCKEYRKYYKDDILNLNITFTNDKKCILSVPFNTNLYLVSPTDNKPIDQYYSTILNIIPEHYINNNVFIMYIDGLSIANSNIQIANSNIQIANNNIQIVNIQYLLYHLLFYYNFFNNEKERIIYGNMYIYVLRMISNIESNKVTIPDNVKSLFMPSLDLLSEFKVIEYGVNRTRPVNYNPHNTGTRQIVNYEDYRISGEKNIL
jgi:hypothetical protein